MRYAFEILCAVVLVVLLGGSAVAGPEPAEGEGKKSADFLATLIHNDMFYGSDDYFGDHRDLAYADRVAPTAEPETQSTTATTTETRTEVSSGAGHSSTTDASTSTTPEVSADITPVDDFVSDDSADDVSDEVDDDVGDVVGDDDAGGG